LNCAHRYRLRSRRGADAGLVPQIRRAEVGVATARTARERDIRVVRLDVASNRLIACVSQNVCAIARRTRDDDVARASSRADAAAWRRKGDCLGSGVRGDPAVVLSTAARTAQQRDSARASDGNALPGIASQRGGAERTRRTATAFYVDRSCRHGLRPNDRAQGRCRTRSSPRDNRQHSSSGNGLCPAVA